MFTLTSFSSIEAVAYPMAASRLTYLTDSFRVPNNHFRRQSGRSLLPLGLSFRKHGVSAIPCHPMDSMRHAKIASRRFRMCRASTDNQADGESGGGLNYPKTHNAFLNTTAVRGFLSGHNLISLTIGIPICTLAVLQTP